MEEESEEFVEIKMRVKPNEFGGTDTKYEVLDTSEELTEDFLRRLYDDHGIDHVTPGCDDLVPTGGDA